MCVKRLLSHYINLYKRCRPDQPAAVAEEESQKMIEIFKKYEEDCTSACSEIMDPSIEPLNGLDSTQRNKLRDVCSSFIELMCVFVSKSAILAVNYHIVAHIRPAIVVDRAKFVALESENFRRFMLTKSAGSSPSLHALYDSVMIISKKYHQFALPRQEKQKKLIIARRIAIMSILRFCLTKNPMFVCGGGSGGLDHLRLDHFNIQVLLEEFQCIYRLFGICSCLPPKYISTSYHNQSTIKNWDQTDFLKLGLELEGIPSMFDILFSENGFGDQQKPSNISISFSTDVLELCRNIMFLGCADTGDSMDAYIRKQLDMGKYFAAMLERGYMLVPRLKRWIMACHRTAMVYVVVHEHFYASQVNMLFL